MHTDSFIPLPCYGNLTNCGFVSIWTSYEIIQIHNNKDSDLSVLNTIHSIYVVQNRCAAWRISQFSLEFFCCTCTLWYCLIISLSLFGVGPKWIQLHKTLQFHRHFSIGYISYWFISFYLFVHFICLFRIYCSFLVQILHHLETFH